MLSGWRRFICAASPPNAEIHKTALGGEDSVAWRYFERTEEAVEELHRKGVFVYSVEQAEGSTKLQDLDIHLLTSAPREMEQDCPAADTSHPTHPLHPRHDTRYALVMGNEVKGVKQTVVDMSDGCLEIPQFGTKHSLNVSVTAGIVIWEFARRLLLE